MKNIKTNKATHEEWLKAYERGDYQEIRRTFYIKSGKKIGCTTIKNAVQSGEGSADVITAITNYYATKTI